MNPKRRIAVLAEAYGPLPANAAPHWTTTAEEAAVMLRFAVPGSPEARKLARQAKGAQAPSVLTNAERAQIERLLARASAATQHVKRGGLPPQRPQAARTDSAGRITDASMPPPVRLQPGRLRR